jgi:hypothetical protein
MLRKTVITGGDHPQLLDHVRVLEVWNESSNVAG